MAKAKVNEALISATKEIQPANPAMSSADKTYLRGLRRRGYTEEEIGQIVTKAGMEMPDDLFVTKSRKTKETHSS